MDARGATRDRRHVMTALHTPFHPFIPSSLIFQFSILNFQLNSPFCPFQI